MSEGWKNETFGCFDDVETCKFVAAYIVNSIL